MSDEVELYYIDGVPASESVPNDKVQGVSVPSQGNVNEPYDEQSEYSRRLETVEKYVDDLRENTIRKDSDASLKSLSIKDRITAFFGRIGGWDIENGKLSTNTIEIDSNNEQIKSVNYRPNVSGFSISSNKVEAQNIVARGILQGSTMQYDTVSAVGGQLMVANADVLDEDMSAYDNSSLVIKGTSSFSVNDILLIRDISPADGVNINEEWLRVTAVNGNRYTVTRDLASQYTADENPAWRKGTTVAKQGVSNGTDTYSGGWLRLFGEGTNSPYYSVFERTGVAYNAYTEACRLGNLNGFLDYTTDDYGIGIGTADGYLKYDTTNGFRVLGQVEAVSLIEAGLDLTEGDAVFLSSDGKVYGADSLVSAQTDAFIGFCASTTTAGNNAPIVITGSSSHQTGLTAGSSYYLQDATHTEEQNTNATSLDFTDNSVDNTQTFTTGVGVDHISAIALNIRQINGGGSTAKVEIRTTGDVLLGDTTFTFDATGWNTYYFNSPIPLDAETQYKLIIKIGSSSNLQFYTSDSNTYADGALNGTGIDLYLKTYVSSDRGEIGAGAGTNSKKAGVALGTTEILITN